MWLLLVFGALLTQAAAAAAAGNEAFNSCLSSYPMRHARLPRFDLVFLVDATLPAMQYDATYNYLRAFGCTLTYSEMYGFDVAVAEYDDDGADIRLQFGQLSDRGELFTELTRLQNVTTAKRDTTAAAPKGDLCKALQTLKAPLRSTTRTNSTKLLFTVLSVEPKSELLNEWAAFKQAWGKEAETWSLLPLVPASTFDGSSLIASLTKQRLARKFMQSKLDWSALSTANDKPYPNVGHEEVRITLTRANGLVLGRAAAKHSHMNVFDPPPPTTAPPPTTVPPKTSKESSAKTTHKSTAGGDSTSAGWVELTSAPAESAPTSTEEPGAFPWLWIIIVGGGLLLLLLVLVLFALCIYFCGDTPSPRAVTFSSDQSATSSATQSSSATDGAAADTRASSQPTQSPSVVSTQRTVLSGDWPQGVVCVPALLVTPCHHCSERSDNQPLDWSLSGSS